MILGKLTDLGIEYFIKFLSDIRSGSNPEYPHYIFENEKYSIPYGDGETEINCKVFDTKLDLVQEIDTILKNPDRKDVESDTHLWAWFALFYFDSIAKKNDKGEYVLDSDNIGFIPNTTLWNRYYRHKILGPYLIYKMHHNHIQETYPLLKTPPYTHGELMENVSGSQKLVSNRTVMELINRLYWDSKNQVLKKGHGSKPGKKGKAGAGSIRRLTVFLNQLNMTYDLYSIPIETLLGLLPAEYNRFRENEKS